MANATIKQNEKQLNHVFGLGHKDHKSSEAGNTCFFLTLLKMFSI